MTSLALSVPLARREVNPWLVALAVVSIVFGALMCMVQSDIKKLIVQRWKVAS